MEYGKMEKISNCEECKKAKAMAHELRGYDIDEAKEKIQFKDRELALRLLSTLTSYTKPGELSTLFREQIINLCKTQL
jgi:hypothetical protein